MDTGHTLEGRSIEAYMPVLTEALRLGTRGGSFRTAAQAQGRRAGGQMFLADLWFSTYTVRDGIQLAAIMVDCSDEMRDPRATKPSQPLHQQPAGSRRRSA